VRKKIAELKKEFTDKKTGFFYKLLAVWTVLQLVMISLEFFKINKYVVPGLMHFAFVAFLCIYVAQKEVERWLAKSWTKRSGEIYLASWYILLMIMFMIEFLTKGRYETPDKMVETCVLIALPKIVTLYSKFKYQRKHGSTHPTKNNTATK